MESMQELFNSLESINPQDAEDAKKKFHELFGSTKETWLLNGMFDYYLQSGSARAIDVLICVREPHDRYLFDRLVDTLRGSHRLSGLTLLGHVVRRHPSWIYKITHHNVFKELLRVLKTERDIVILMSALLIIVILLPIIASLISPYLHDLFDIFSHLAVWNTNNPYNSPECYLIHLEIGMYVFFNRLYGMFPCNFLSYLRQHYNSKESLPIFSRTIKPMLDSVRMHPLLVTATKELEVSNNRWKRIEANDVIIECSKISIENDISRDDCSFSKIRSFNFHCNPAHFGGAHYLYEPRPSDAIIELGNRGIPVVSNFSSTLPETADIWSPAFQSGVATPPGGSTITQTPIIQGIVASYPVHSGSSPPEAAIEATPESTPIREMHEPSDRVHSVFSPGGVRTRISSQPSSPLKKEQPTFKSPTPGIQRVQRIINDRTQVESVGLKGNQSPLRVIHQLERQRPHTPGERTDEDREVETTFSAPMSSSSQQPVIREDSVLGESSEKAEDGEWREWQEGGDLKMPESHSFNQIVRRFRYVSLCHSDTYSQSVKGFSSAAGSSPKEGVKVFVGKLRKISSCPELLRPKNPEKNNLKSHSSSVQNNSTAKTYSSLGTQTDPPHQPLLYEQLLYSVLAPVEPLQQRSAPPDVTSPPSFRDDHVISSPRASLDSFIEATVKSLNEKIKLGVDNSELRQLREQLVLVTLQLQFERHRREVHAERNRRLLGRYRENRVLEEDNSALRNQVHSLQTDIDMLRKELKRFKKDSRATSDEQQESINYWGEQNASLQRRLKESSEIIRSLSEDLKEEKHKKETIAKGYAKLESEVFGLRNMMDDAVLAVQRAQEVKAELASCQHHVQAASELESRLRSRIDNLQVTCNKGLLVKDATKAYQGQINDLHKKLDAEEVHREAVNEKLKKAEVLYNNTQALTADHRALIEGINQEWELQLKEKEECSSKLRALNSEREMEILRLQAQVECLEEKVRKLSLGKQIQGSSPQLSPHLSSGSLSITEGTPQMQNLQLLVDRSEGCASSSKDVTFPP